MNHLYIPQNVRVKVNLDPINLTKQYETEIRHSISEKYGNHCYKNGFIKKSSITVTKISSGFKEGAHLHGFMTFYVDFSASFCVPTNGTSFTCQIKSINKFGVCASVYPMDIIIPRHLQAHMGDVKLLENLYVGEQITVKSIKYEIDHEKDRIVVIAIITDIEQSKHNYVDLPSDCLGGIQYKLLIGFDSKQPDESPRLGSSEKLAQQKQKLGPYADTWTKYIRKMINPHELLSKYTDGGYNVVKYSKDSIYSSDSVYPVISRAYFKLWEILTDTKMLDQYKDQSIYVLNLSESLGGFIQCLIDFRNHQHSQEWKKDTYYSFLTRAKNDLPSVSTEYLDLIVSDKHKYLVSTTYGDQTIIDVPSKCHLITADGGIAPKDEEFGSGELESSKIFLSEIVTALKNQARGGTFIIKLYDTYYETTIQMIQILTIYYNQVSLIKPYTCSPANAEKYLVCSDFKDIATIEDINALTTVITTWKENEYLINLSQMIENPASTFIRDIKDFNEQLLTNRLSCIMEGWKLVTNSYYVNVIDKYLAKQTETAKLWCQKYKLPYN